MDREFFIVLRRALLMIVRVAERRDDDESVTIRRALLMIVRWIEHNNRKG